MPMPGMPMAGGSPEIDHLPVAERLLDFGNFQLELDAKLEMIHRFCTSRYLTPPARAQYLLLFHEMAGVGVCINGRKFLGNTPTLLASPTTHMRFGAVAMGSMFHTFHLHGHRWVLPGPEGDNIGAIQSSPQVKAVSQFEDTRTFGPANSFVFAIDEGQNFMRAKPEAPSPRGEWHLHCHVLDHMMDGMMGSLLIIDGGELAFGLPQGTDPDGSVAVAPPSTNPTSATIDMKLDAGNPSGYSFVPTTGVTVAPGAAITFHHVDGADPHQIVWDTPVPASRPHPANSLVSAGNLGPIAMPNQTGTYPYHCGVHGASMNGSITVA
jgi:plastocyanin